MHKMMSVGLINMKLPPEDELLLAGALGSIMEDEVALRMKNYIQHGVVSTYEHAENVARVSYMINKAIGGKANLKVLLGAAFLHDFYLYDWHIKSGQNKMHGFRHPKIAADNAYSYYGIGRKEREAIESHMWPLTITKIPRSREAWIVCFADKYCSCIETIAMRKEKRGSCT